MSITCREKLEIDHPEFIDEKWNGGCKDCPHTYGYKKMDDCACDCKTCDNDICTRCWDEPYEGELTPLEEKYFELKQKREECHYINKDVLDLYGLSLRCVKHTYSHPSIGGYSSNLRNKLLAIKYTLNDLNSELIATRYTRDEMEQSRNRWRASWWGLVTGSIIAFILVLIL